MPAHRLRPRPVERVWGRQQLPACFARAGTDAPIGEIWFEEAGAPELLVKYLFTAERLSIQVHPGDDSAPGLGLARGKDEAWLVLDAEPGAVIGLGLVRDVAAAELRAAALDGSIERLIDWRPVKAGDFLYSPAGTIHAIGAGIALIELQQNLDLTYRLYDYGRPRPLQLEEALGVAARAPWRAPFESRAHGPGRDILAAGLSFVVERWTFEGAAALAGGETMLIVPLAPGATLDGEALAPGSVWSVRNEAEIHGNVDLLAAYPGPAIRDPALARWPRSKLRA